MYLWRCVFIAVLGLFWYFLEFGQFLVQMGFCALCFCVIFLAGGNSKVFERSTQTDCAAGEAISQLPQKSETGHIVGRDEPDTAVRTVQKSSQQSQYPNVQRSLQHMFECAYTHLVLPWSTAPELGESLLLHSALLTEFNLIIDEVICRANDLDLAVTALGCIQIFTKHLHNTKQSEGSPAFSSKAEELAELRGFCKVLIKNLLPKHLWESNVYYCALQEIMALKVLEFMTLLSDPDNMNHLIVSQLDQTPSENLMENRDIPSSKRSESSDGLHSETEGHSSEECKAKKKGKNVKETFSRVFNRIRPKKVKLKRKEKKAIERAVSFRRTAVIETDGTSSNEGSICDSGDDSSESPIYFLQEMMIELKLSFEMWRAGKWAVTVTNVQMEGDELCFTVHLEDSNNPENLHWDVKKCQSDIIQFNDQCKQIGHLPSLLTIVDKPKIEWNEEEARELLEHFLQDLVAIEEFGKSELVFMFLGPTDWIHEEKHNEGVWFLLDGIASFLTFGQDNDEISDLKAEKKSNEVIDNCNTSEDTAECELASTQPMCTDMLERHDKESDDELLEADVGPLPTPDQTVNWTSEKQNKDDAADLFDQAEVKPVEFQSVDVNIAHFAARTRYLKFEHNFKRQASTYSASENDEDHSIHCSTNILPDCKYTRNISKEENVPHRKASETDKPEKMEKDLHPEEEMLRQSSGEKKKSISLEQPEENKVIFDLLKEISGNSYTFKIMKAVITPFTPLINKKANAFLKKMNPSEAQIAAYIDSLCEGIWPDRAVSQPLSQSSDNKTEIKQKALQIMTSKFAGLAIINKTNVENIFKIFQNAEENKKLVHMLMKYLLEDFLPGEPGFKVMSS